MIPKEVGEYFPSNILLLKAPFQVIHIIMRINSAIAHPISGLSAHSKHKKESKLSINKDSRNNYSNQALRNSTPHGCKQ